MRYSTGIAALALAGFTIAQETVLGVYIFARHGDRTAKSTPPANLTDLGYQEVFMTGDYFRNRYITSNAQARIMGMNSDLVKQSQIAVSAPEDTVLQNSAQGFLQGLYPPVGPDMGSNQLRNGTVIRSPLNGYQLIPVNMVESGANSENSAWLQGSTGCANAMQSSKDYTKSASYLSAMESSQGLYDRIHPDVAATFNESSTNFKNAYTIWDLLNVASIHNQSATLPNNADFFQLKLLADEHESNSAFNASEPIRAITGSTIAAQVVEALNKTITSKGKSKLNIQFGAYAGMMSFFGQSNLISKSVDFYGVPDYASSLTWELVTNSSVDGSSWPSADDIYVRFLFANGTATPSNPPTEFALFGTNVSPMPWNDFVQGMNTFAIPDQQSWCQACGNSTGVCAPSNFGDEAASASSSIGSSGNGGISKAVAGVIGAMVTLGVILIAELLILLVGGLTISKRRRAGQQQRQSPNSSVSGETPLKGDA